LPLPSQPYEEYCNQRHATALRTEEESGTVIQAALDSTAGLTACEKSLLFRRSELKFILSLEGLRRKVLALNGLQPLKKALSSFVVLCRQVVSRD
jgi:hypothetical protein